MDWPLLWKIMLVIMLGLFFVMAVIGTILGARDIRKLLKHLRHPEEEPRTEPNEPESDRTG